jgi:hypothetical protein
MDQDKSDKPAPRRRPEGRRVVPAEQQVRFLLGVRNGMTVKIAARWAEVGETAIYWLRRNDAGFAALWREAFAGAKADAAAARAQARAAADAAQGTKIANDGGTVLKRKRRPAVAFTPERKQLFLDHFAESCNMAAAAAAAGVTVRCVRKALAEDEAFSDAFDVATAVGYRALEADTLHQAQMAYRLSPDGPAGATDGAGGRQTFERSMQLLQQFRRRDGSVGRRPSRHDRKMASKEEVIAAIVKNIKMVRQRRQLLAKAPPPPPGEPGPMDC